VGNRAVGDRLSATVADDRLRIAAALVLTSPGVPMLFQGEEWGCTSPFQYFTDHQDRELGRAVAQGRRSEFGAFGWEPEQVPDPQDPATYERSRLDWSQLGEGRHAALLDWYRQLLELRRTEPDLGPGDRVDGVESDGVAGWLRVDRGAWSIAVNLGASAARIPCRDGRVALRSPASVSEAVTGGSIELGPDAVALVDTRS
jgi:maltooligosyltrehalose trehalohydrolase